MSISRPSDHTVARASQNMFGSPSMVNFLLVLQWLKEEETFGAPSSARVAPVFDTLTVAILILDLFFIS